VSAEVEEVTLYNAFCNECVDAFEHEDEDRAIEWAANHDAENHAEDDSLDDDYEAFKEAHCDVL
jgi:hypothetical protein